MKDINLMLKKLNMFIVSEVIDEENGENVFMLMEEKTEEIKAYRYTDIVDAYRKLLEKQFDF